MIHPDSRTKGWIEHVANEYRIRDIALVEKTIRAFSLLESLVRSECPLLFKGGTACMIHLNSALHIFPIPERKLIVITFPSTLYSVSARPCCG